MKFHRFLLHLSQILCILDSKINRKDNMKLNIKKFDPCSDGFRFYEKFETFEAAWNSCPRGDWMLWMAKKMTVGKRKLTLAKGLCAQTVINLMKGEISKRAVQAAIDYGNGIIESNELRRAYIAADAAVDHVDYIDSAHYYICADLAAFYASADADPDVVAEYAGESCADLAASNAPNAVAVAADAARKKNQGITADICREILTSEVFEKVNQHLKGES